MSLEDERAAFRLAHLAWEVGDFEGFLSCFTEDVLYTVNVDGVAVPYASSALGKEDVRQRMQLLLDTFTVDKFQIESLVHEADHSRSSVLGNYTHKKTGERLSIRIRFRGVIANGLIAHLDEHHDAPYVEAFQRFVHHLQQAAEAAEC